MMTVAEFRCCLPLTTGNHDILEVLEKSGRQSGIDAGGQIIEPGSAAIAKSLAATARAAPMTLQPLMREEFEMVAYGCSVCGAPQKFGVRLQHAWQAMSALVKRPLAVLAKMSLADEKITERNA